MGSALFSPAKLTSFTAACARTAAGAELWEGFRKTKRPSNSPSIGYQDHPAPAPASPAARSWTRSPHGLPRPYFGP